MSGINFLGLRRPRRHTLSASERRLSFDGSGSTTPASEKTEVSQTLEDNLQPVTQPPSLRLVSSSFSFHPTTAFKSKELSPPFEGNSLPITRPPSLIGSGSVTPSHTEAGTATPVVPDELGISGKSPSLLFQPRSSFYRRMALVCQKHNPQLVFENRGSTARDHLASERTFLAYVRTSLALASAGVALVQLFTIADSKSTSASGNLQGFARPLGVSIVLMGLSMLVIAVYRYFLIQNSLPNNAFPVARISIVFTTFVLTAVVVVTFGTLLGSR